MNDQNELSLMDKLLGLNWRTTAGGAMAAAGGVLAAAAPSGSRWQVAGQVIGAIGVAWIGLASRDRVVTGAQMSAVQDAKDGTKPLPTVQEIKQP